jgi:hypothetical protein
MVNARSVDFLFTGLAVVPAVLLLTGHPGPALLLFVPLLIGACLAGMYEQRAMNGRQRECVEESVPEPALTAAGPWRKRLD